MAERTKAQQEAAKRNWRIRRLRALYAQCSMLRADRADIAREAIDMEIMDMGAESEEGRRFRQRKELETFLAHDPNLPS